MKVQEYKKINNDKELAKSKKKLKVVFNLYRRLVGFERKGTSKAEMTINLPKGQVIQTNAPEGTYGEITGTCIACGKKLVMELFSDKSILNGRSFHASHYFDADKCPNIEFYEDNVWLSCSRCNSPYGLHGNKPDYKDNLLKKIGQKRYDKLVLAKNTITKSNILDIDRLIFEYKDKSKAEARRLGVKV